MIPMHDRPVAPFGVRGVEGMDVLRELIWYLCVSRPYGLLRTELVKFVYLCDVEFYRRFNRSITGLRYEYGDFGPFHWDILDQATAMVDEGLLSYKPVPAIRRGCFGYVFDVAKDKREEIKLSKLDSRTLSVVQSVLERFSSLSLDALLDYVHTTVPTSLFEKGEVIEFGEWIPNTDLGYVAKSRIRKRLAELRQSARTRMHEECSEYEVDAKQEDEAHADIVSALMPHVAELVEGDESRRADNQTHGEIN